MLPGPPQGAAEPPRLAAMGGRRLGDGAQGVEGGAEEGGLAFLPRFSFLIAAASPPPWLPGSGAHLGKLLAAFWVRVWEAREAARWQVAAAKPLQRTCVEAPA